MEALEKILEQLSYFGGLMGLAYIVCRSFGVEYQTRKLDELEQRIKELEN